MSVVYGAVGFDDPAGSVAMEAALEEWPRDHVGRWRGRDAALGIVAQWSLQEAVGETQPLQHPGSARILVADVRLDNRPELTALLGTEPGLSDAALLLLSFVQWGRECVRHLVGDFAFAVWDAREHELFCATDRFGIRPLWYAQEREGLIFAGEPRALLAHPAVPHRLNEEWIARHLSGLYQEHEASPFAAVRVLPPAHRLHLSRGRLSIDRYWRLDPPRPEGEISEAELVAEVRTRLDRAVADRLRSVGPIAAELTSGIDSATVVGTALPLLRQKGQDLTVVSMLQSPDRRDLWPFEDESAGVERVCRHHGITRRLVADARGRGLIGPVDRFTDRHGVPCDSFTLSCEEIHALAAERGIRVLLTGQGGDEGFSAHPGRAPVDWLRSGRLPAALGHVRANARDKGVPWAGTLARLAVKAWMPGTWDRLVVRRHRARWRREVAAGQRLLAPGYAAEHRIEQRCLEQRSRLLVAPKGPPPPIPLCAMDAAGYYDRLRWSTMLTRTVRLEYRYPLLDQRLLEFIAALPSDRRIRQGRGRWLAYRVAEDRVPQASLWIGKPAIGFPCSVPRLVDDRERLLTRIAGMRARPESARRLDLDAMTAAVRAVTPGAEFEAVVYGRILTALQVDRLLSRFDDRG